MLLLVHSFNFDAFLLCVLENFISLSETKLAINLDLKICKKLGIGNSTGLGMAPFIVNHPTLLNNWILSRETALKKIREIKVVKKEESELFKDCVKRSLKNITNWNTDSKYQQKKIKSLLKNVEQFIEYIENEFDFKTEHPFNKI